MKIISRVFIFTLIGMSCLMILTGCQAGQMYKPQPAELPDPLYLEIADNDDMAVEPEQPTVPQASAQVYETHPLVPADEVIYILVYTPPEVPPATLAEAFAAVVWRFTFLDGSENDPFPRHSFSLMDIDLDGELELIVHMTGWPNGFPDFVVFNKDLALEFIYLPNEHYEVFTFLSHNSVSGVRPMRFYRNDDTGDVIFSSLSHGAGGGVGHWITYTNNRTLETFRVVECSLAGEIRHLHRLWDGGRRWHGTLITYRDIGPEEWGRDTYPCILTFESGSVQEVDSLAPTIVELVNLATEGFAEISAPERHEFYVDYELFFSDYVEEIIAWIHSIVGQGT